MAHPSEVVTRPALNPPTIILRRRAIEPRADPGQRIDRAVAGAVRMIAAGDIDTAKGGAPLAHGLGEFPSHHRRDQGIVAALRYQTWRGNGGRHDRAGERRGGE